MRVRKLPVVSALFAVVILVTGCGSDSSPGPRDPDGGTGESGGHSGSGGRSTGTGGSQGPGGSSSGGRSSDSGGSGGSSSDVDGGGTGGESGGSGGSSDMDSGSTGGRGTSAGGGASDSGADGPFTCAAGATTITVGPSGGMFDGPSGSRLDVPAGAVSETTTLCLTTATLPTTLPNTVQSMATGIGVDLGGATLALPAKLHLALPLDATDDEALILSITEPGTGVVPPTLVKGSTVTDATVDVARAGNYFPVQLVSGPDCTDIVRGDQKLQVPADVNALAKVKRIAGNLTITGEFVQSLANLKCLARVDGDVVIQTTNLTSLAGLEKLTVVGTTGVKGFTLSDNPRLTAADLPSLAALGSRIVGGFYDATFDVQNNPVLASFSADATDSAGLLFEKNGASAIVTTVSMAALRRAPSVNLFQNPALASLDDIGSMDAVRDGFTVYLDQGLFSLDNWKAPRRLGSLTVTGCWGLTSAAGLARIESADQLTFESNSLLPVIRLPALTNAHSPAIRTSILLRNNPVLTTFEAHELPSASTIQLASNAKLNTLDFSRLKSVKGLAVYDPSGLVDLTGFASLTSITDGITLVQTDKLTSLHGLESVTTIGDLTLQKNAALTSIAALSNVTQMRTVDIESNPKLTEFQSAVTSLENLSVVSNDALKKLAFPGLTTASGFNIRNNVALTTFSAGAVSAPVRVGFEGNGTTGTPLDVNLASLTSLTGGLWVVSNRGAMTFNAGGLSTVPDYVTIRGNGMTALTLTSLRTVGGTMEISSNYPLQDLTLPNLKSVTGALLLNSNGVKNIALPSLETVESLETSGNSNLETVSMDALTSTMGEGANGNFFFLGNRVLASTELSFASLTRVGYFQMSGNFGLKKVGRFPKLTRVDNGLQFYNNPDLPTCEAVGFRDQIKKNGTITGFISISYNLQDGCTGL